MWVAIILLAVLATVANVTADEIRFHWDRTFGRIIKPGSRWYQWMNPSVSWDNKYFNSWILTKIFSTILVWVTDLWHLCKFTTINSAFAIFLLMQEAGELWWQFIVELIVLNLLWGMLYELTAGIYGAIGDRFKLKL